MDLTEVAVVVAASTFPIVFQTCYGLSCSVIKINLEASAVAVSSSSSSLNFCFNVSCLIFTLRCKLGSSAAQVE